MTFDPSTIDGYARAGRRPKSMTPPTGVQGPAPKVMSVREAKHERMEVRDWLGNSRQDTPTIVAMLAAASALSALLVDASGNTLRLIVEDIDGDSTDLGVAISMLLADEKARR